MKIIGFGLPTTFPDYQVPLVVAQFCAEIDGMEFADAIRLALERGYEPIIMKLHQQGEHVWGFGLLAEGVNVPLMVTVDQDASTTH